MDITKVIQKNVKAAVKAVFDCEIKESDVFVEHPREEGWGDYATNVAMKLAPQIKQSPAEIAKKLCYELQSLETSFNFNEQRLSIFKKVDFATNGFINFELSKEWLYYVLFGLNTPNHNYKFDNVYTGKKVLFEYTDPNPFKVFHIGHLMSNCIGESLSRILEFVGAHVKRANYQGDVGMHVAKSIWGMDKKLKDDGLSIEDLSKRSIEERVAFLGECYALGATAYKEDPDAVPTIKDINYLVFIAAQNYFEKSEGWVPKVDYKKYLQDVESLDPAWVQKLYENGRAWSLEYFETVYRRVGTKFDFYYFESLAGELGFEIVKKALKKGIFEENDGAVIFAGEKYGLHTRVFVNSLGLPTYEAKELGLAKRKYEDYQYDLSVIVTANEIEEYFKVLIKAMEFIYPKLASKTKHVPHGVMKFKSGKMSSRTGDVITGPSLIDEVAQVILEKMESGDVLVDSTKQKAVADKIAVGALKYGVLKHNIGRDIVFDKDQALALSGDTGPYLQYTCVRTNSVLEKVDWEGDKHQLSGGFGTFGIEETELAILRWIYRFPEVVEKAAVEFAPNLLCEYLFELAQRFNAFYANVSILGAKDEYTKNFRLLLTNGVRKVLKDGLYLLGIAVVEKM